jgi:hypothetical protein
MITIKDVAPNAIRIATGFESLDQQGLIHLGVFGKEELTLKYYLKVEKPAAFLNGYLKDGDSGATEMKDIESKAVADESAFEESLGYFLENVVLNNYENTPKERLEHYGVKAVKKF